MSYAFLRRPDASAIRPKAIKPSEPGSGTVTLTPSRRLPLEPLVNELNEITVSSEEATKTELNVFHCLRVVCAMTCENNIDAVFASLMTTSNDSLSVSLAV